MIPARMLPHTAVIVTPSTSAVDRYKQPVVNYTVPPATTRTVSAFIQPASQEELLIDRDAASTFWNMITNDTALDHLDRVTWQGRTFELMGNPAVYSTPRGEHHRTARLREVTG